MLPSAPGPSRRTGIYVHIPFCIVRCAYCDFNAYAGMEHLAPAYTDALLREISSAADGRRIDTVFFGGGTPTQLEARELTSILRCIKDSFSVGPEAEVTIEANPESVDEAKFAALAEAGFNRVSVGIQSTAPHVLGYLGRVHTARRGLDALAEARRAGVARVNADLIYGTPGETEDDWRRSLDDVLAAGVDHVSAYALTIEQGTPLDTWVTRGERPGPDEDVQAGRCETADSVLTRAGMVRYEVSNWARPDSWCDHNLGYWRSEDYLAFGAGAHGHLSGRRWWNVKSPQGYIERSPLAEDGGESLDGDRMAEDAAILGLRLAGGLDRGRFVERWGTDPLQRWPGLEQRAEDGLLEVDDTHVRPTSRGMLLLNEALMTIVSPEPQYG